MFQADVRSPWTYGHCWEVLKYCDKWIIILQSNPMPPSPVYEETHETLVSLDSDQDPYSNTTVSSPRKRPPGRKVVKESRQKSKASPTDTSNSISDTIRELFGQSEKRKNFYDEQKLQLLKEQKLQLLKEQAQREDVQLEIARRAEDRMQKEQDRLQMIADYACDTPSPIRPDWRIRTEVRGARLSILYTRTLIDLFFIGAVPVPVGIQTIFLITKIILHIQKNYHRSGVHHNLYTYTESFFLIHVQFLLQNIRDCGNSAGEHLSLSRPALLMWNVLSSSLLFGTYTD